MGSAGIWKKNIIENLKSGNLSHIITEEFLSDLKEEFSGENTKTIKMVKLKKLKQKNKIMEEFVQKFRRAARESRFQKRLLIRKFKRDMNRVI